VLIELLLQQQLNFSIVFKFTTDTNYNSEYCK